MLLKGLSNAFKLFLSAFDKRVPKVFKLYVLICFSFLDFHAFPEAVPCTVFVTFLLPLHPGRNPGQESGKKSGEKSRVQLSRKIDEYPCSLIADFPMCFLDFPELSLDFAVVQWIFLFVPRCVS